MHLADFLFRIVQEKLAGVVAFAAVFSLSKLRSMRGAHGKLSTKKGNRSSKSRKSQSKRGRIRNS